MEKLLVILGLIIACHGASLEGRAHGHPDHGHGEYIPPTSEVDHAIDDTHEHYNSHLCLEILLLPCSAHRPVADERVCGSDGVLYPDHCHFAHARCIFTDLRVDHHGWCLVPETHPTHSTSTPAPTPLPHLTHATYTPHPTSTPAPTLLPHLTHATHTPHPTSTPAPTPLSHSTHATHIPHPTSDVTTMEPLVTSPDLPVMTSSETIMPVATHLTQSHTDVLHSTTAPATVITTAEKETTPQPPTTPPPEVSTKDATHEIFQNVFCANAHLIHCSLADDIYLCGSDGQTYYNRCFLSKVKCLKPSLRTSTDFTLCQ